MVLLEKLIIDISQKKFAKASSFIIERFVVPENQDGLMLSFQMAYDYINLILVYDSNYNLRAETTQIHERRVIKIHEQDLYTSNEAKAGLIPEGEWIIAFEINNEELPDVESLCMIEVTSH
ncbi:hypothetical protein FEZ33_04005 [Ruoffia tabacinasalis]|uniref:Uncharacterized protein n=1 Tax=Ruoffia tabacinasalis TaxID=87458 RepID=A0A5R9DYL3_9LACT|nr:hypothetical protein [Ruoffia tabacinasalis]TLQ41852.1 hypothetical protein FEZ33_04005 [Ruoffia tabacinasalis]